MRSLKRAGRILSVGVTVTIGDRKNCEAKIVAEGFPMGLGSNIKSHGARLRSRRKKIDSDLEQSKENTELGGILVFGTCGRLDANKNTADQNNRPSIEMSAGKSETAHNAAAEQQSNTTELLKTATSPLNTRPLPSTQTT